jgi:sulfur-oxidizing protein SoxX
VLRRILSLPLRGRPSGSPKKRLRFFGVKVGVGALLATTFLTASAQELVRYTVQGDGIPQPLAGATGDPQRGRAIVASRQVGLCLLCHPAPIPEERFQGDLAPSLAGVGARYSPAQLRLRIVDPRRVNPSSFMPAFHSAGNPSRVAAGWAGKPILSAQQVEDVVAWLATLR